MAVTTKITVFWDMKPYILVDTNQCFGETCRLDPVPEYGISTFLVS